MISWCSLFLLLLCLFRLNTPHTIHQQVVVAKQLLAQVNGTDQLFPTGHLIDGQERAKAKLGPMLESAGVEMHLAQALQNQTSNIMGPAMSSL